MKKSLKIVLIVSLLAVLALAAIAPALAASEGAMPEGDIISAASGSVDAKAVAAAIVVGLAAAAGAIGMGMAIAKSVYGIARQPEAEGKIRTTLMLGLVFVETAIIYALVVAILIIFVL